MVSLISLLLVLTFLISLGLLFRKVRPVVLRWILSLAMAVFVTFLAMSALENFLVDSSPSGREVNIICDSE